MITKENLQSLFDDVLELEALISLAIQRDDCSDNLIRLIERKLKKICDAEPEIGSCSEIKESEEKADNEKTQSLLNSVIEYSMDYDESDITAESNYNNEVDNDEESDDNSADSLAEEQEEKEVQTGSADIEEVDEDYMNPDQPEYNYNSDDFSESPEEEIIREEKVSRGPVFTINDKYRFKHGLFHDSEAEFNTTMAFVASMDDYDEAEEYFLGELGFDSKNPDVADFLKILSRYFK